jgi:twitching motility protein PilT
MNQTPEQFWTSLTDDALRRKATDILFSRGTIYFRVDMDVVPHTKQLDPAGYRSVLLWPVGDGERLGVLNGKTGSVDFGFSFNNRRFRFNIYRDYCGYSAACRPLPEKSYRPEEIGISKQILRAVSETSRGLILVTGPTGSGKSSTICSLVEHLNQTRRMNILTVEDPIEYMFTPGLSIVEQREVGNHVPDFATALKAAMRQNPDVIFVGEIRDLETATAALQAADTGHLVFSTLHTQRVFATISRIIEIAPANKQSEIRSLLSNTLTMVMGQRLLRRRGGGIVAAREILVNNAAAGALIRAGKEKSLTNVMVSGRDRGMIDWESCLLDLYKTAVIDEEEYAVHKDTEL